MRRELELAVELARSAGAEIQRVFGTDFAVEFKPGDEGPVTEADRLADRLIRDGLAAAFPADAILSEETPDDLTRLGAERLWLVDPLDGTRQFVEAVPEFAVMIGLAVRGRPVLGVIHLPAEQRTVFGAEGEGIELLDRDGWRPLAPLPEGTEPARGPVVTLSRSHAGSRTREIARRLGASRVIASGSVGRKVTLVLTGEADLYVTLGRRSRHWDACAPDALMRLAGGVFSDVRGREMSYNTEGTTNRSGLLAARRALLAPTVQAIATVIPETPVSGA
ncbi:MAG: 3'(2'),5'-bisphosphate nucleotidase CysQ [Acidobacteria bacterium]|nr:3'(2'),5'-bisphosphate nucleotidase CysQ [Acidobacteriota bacterium]MCU0253636.1 3'(2'),5'-bisphosphate nucleotidase CysQ [Acidobacteriota bacterium]